MMRRSALSLTHAALLLLAGSGRSADTADQPAAEPSDVLVAGCTDEGVEIDARTVAVQRDGLHIRATNRSDGRMVLRVANGGFEIAQGTTEQVRYVAPGGAAVSCGDANNGDVGDEVTVEVVDPHGVFVTGEIDCRGGSAVMYDSAGTEPQATADAAARTVLQPTTHDVLRQVGYPDQESEHWVLEREGRVIATATVRQDAKGFVSYPEQACG